MCSKEICILFFKFVFIYLISQVILFTLYFYLVSEHDLLKSLIVTLPLSLFIPAVYLIFDKFVCSEENPDI